jgi:hypothetical protein
MGLFDVGNKDIARMGRQFGPVLAEKGPTAIQHHNGELAVNGMVVNRQFLSGAKIEINGSSPN